MHSEKKKCSLILEDGSTFEGYSFGCEKSVAGEVVFNTGMVGYPESLTDPSYKGQILVLTYPLIGNYGIPQRDGVFSLDAGFESNKVQIQGLVVSNYSFQYSHWDAVDSLDNWLKKSKVPALYGVDTRRLTKRLREKGSMLGKIVVSEGDTPFWDPNTENLISKVSIKEPVTYTGGKARLVVIDCGCKTSIIRSLLARGVTVFRVPWDYDFLSQDFDAVVISNGPGDPKMCQETVTLIKEVMKQNKPVLGICLGHQILALAAGAETYKLKFGHRSQNQPCVEIGTDRCYITSQNHGYAVRAETLLDGWYPWFTNANDGSNEGMRHRSRPFMSVQFHPEAAPGPTDTNYVFDEFLRML